MICKLVPKIPVKKPVVARTIVANKEVDVACVVVERRPVKFWRVVEPMIVMFPLESTLKAVVVAPREGTASTRKRSKFGIEDVAEMVRIANGEVEPIPTRVPPAV